MVDRPSKTTAVEPLSAEEIAEMEANHRSIVDVEGPAAGVLWCKEDGQDGPCDVTRLIATVKATDAEIERLRALLTDWGKLDAETPWDWKEMDDPEWREKWAAMNRRIDEAMAGEPAP